MSAHGESSQTHIAFLTEWYWLPLQCFIQTTWQSPRRFHGGWNRVINDYCNHPSCESFGLAPELFRQSSGEVTAPELIFSHWARLDQDPFWIPTSLEEREDFGEIMQNGDVSTGMDNTALNYIRNVRARKGLLVDSSRTVVAAEKQRTMKR